MPDTRARLVSFVVIHEHVRVVRIMRDLPSAVRVGLMLPKENRDIDLKPAVEFGTAKTPEQNVIWRF